jgi:integrase
VAADAALLRGELVALRTDSLHDRNVHVVCSSRDGTIRPLTNHRRATMVLGAYTADCWTAHVDRWRGARGQGPWLFATGPDRATPLTPSGLGQRFTKLARRAQLPDASLHRLRHTVGTYLVADGKILQASKRLRHRDVSTTYRAYQHAVPIDDHGAADHLARLYGFDNE